MFDITDRAVEKAKAMLAEEGKDAWGIRIYIAEQGRCGPVYGLNIQKEHLPTDDVFEKNGLKVFMNKNISEILSGMQLDYYSDENVEGFIFTGIHSSCSPDFNCY